MGSPQTQQPETSKPVGRAPGALPPPFARPEEQKVAAALPAPIPGRLAPEAALERMNAVLTAVHAGGDKVFETFAPQVKTLVAEIDRDIKANALDPKKVALLATFAAAATETFNPDSKEHQSMVTDTIRSLRSAVRAFETKLSDGTIKTDLTTRDNLRAVEGMWNVLCVNKIGEVSKFQADGLLPKDSPIARFTAKISELDTLPVEAVRARADAAVSALTSSTTPAAGRAEAYLDLAAAYYRLKAEPGYKAQLVAAMDAFAKQKEQPEVVQSAAICLAHASWSSLSPEQVSAIHQSPQRDIVLPFAAILTDVVDEKSPSATSTRESWRTYLGSGRAPAAPGGDFAQQVLERRLQLLDQQ